MKHILLSSLLLAAPAVAQDEPDETENAAPQGGQGANVGGAGIQTGAKDNASAGTRKTETASGGGSAGGASGPCQEEDLNWKPGKGGPATAVEGQAMRAQKEDTTIAYRVRASQLGEQGNFGFYTDSHQGSWMRLSKNKCEVTFQRGPCEVDYGAVTLTYASSGVLKARTGSSKFPSSVASKICVIPAPAGKVGGENYWWLNVHTKGPCAGGTTWFGGGKTEKGTCVRAIVYEAHEASGAPAGSSASAGSGSGSAAASPPVGTISFQLCAMTQRNCRPAAGSSMSGMS